MQTPDVIIVDAEDGAKEVVVGGVAAGMVSIGTQTLVDVDEQGHCQIPPQFVVEDQKQNQELEAAELKIKVSLFIPLPFNADINALVAFLILRLYDRRKALVIPRVQFFKSSSQLGNKLIGWFACREPKINQEGPNMLFFLGGGRDRGWEILI